MVYADTDFFLALMKKSDWLQEAAKRILEEYRDEIWTSPVTLLELLLLAEEYELDPERLLIDVLEIAKLEGGETGPFISAARYLKEHKTGVFDALHAAFCAAGGIDCKIISSDKVFEKLGLERIPLESGVDKG